MPHTHRKQPAKYRCEQCGSYTVVKDSWGQDGLVLRTRECPNHHRMRTVERPHEWSPSANGWHPATELELDLPDSERKSHIGGEDNFRGHIWRTNGQIS
jgi:hypothetical protein